MTICFVELRKNEFGLIHAVQTIETACIRTFIKRCDLNSVVYVEESMPSISDMAEDVLSLSDEVIVFIVNNECKEVVATLIDYILDIEDVEICVISKENLNVNDNVIFLPKDAEKKLVELYGNRSKAENLSMNNISPYADGIILARDYTNYGIWVGRDNNSLRSYDILRDEINSVFNLYSGLSNAQHKEIVLQGCFINKIDLVRDIIVDLEARDTSFIKFIIPIHQEILSEISKLSLNINNYLFNVKLYENIDYDNNSIIEKLIALGKVRNLSFPANWLTHNDAKLNFLVSAQNGKLIHLLPYGEVDSALISDAIKHSILKDTIKQYYTYYRGYLKSRTGLYAGVKTDGYVHHFEAKDEDSISDGQLVNETLSINSSIYMRDKKVDIKKAIWNFDDNGIAYVKNNSYEEYIQYMREKNINPTNLIVNYGDRVYINSYAYTDNTKLVNLTYKEAKDKINVIMENHKKNQKTTYLFKLVDKEDFDLFVEDARRYKEQHQFMDLPLGYGFLENSCRFISQTGCVMEKLPRIKLDNSDKLHFCDMKAEPLATNSNALFELSHNCLVKKESCIHAKNCYSCPSQSWCAKCTELPDFISSSYCDIIKKQAFILDYVVSSYVYNGLVETNPNYFDLMPDEIYVSNEYMFNLIPSTVKGKVAPYFPKFTTLFLCREKYLFWSPISNKYYNVSKEFAIVIELLLKRVDGNDVPALLSDILDITEIESYSLVENIFSTLKTVGILYRDIPFSGKANVDNNIERDGHYVY